jgi:hypothetical protein
MSNNVLLTEEKNQVTGSERVTCSLMMTVGFSALLRPAKKMQDCDYFTLRTTVLHIQYVPSTTTTTVPETVPVPTANSGKPG